MVVQLRGTGPQKVPLVVDVFDADMNRLTTEVVGRNGNAMLVSSGTAEKRTMSSSGYPGRRRSAGQPGS